MSVFRDRFIGSPKQSAQVKLHENFGEPVVVVNTHTDPHSETSVSGIFLEEDLGIFQQTNTYTDRRATVRIRQTQIAAIDRGFQLRVTRTGDVWDVVDKWLRVGEHHLVLTIPQETV